MGEWKEYILEDIIDEFIDYRGKTPQKKESGIPLITAKIVKNGRILEPNEFIDPDDYDSWMTRGLPEVDDIVLTTEAPLGEVALIKNKKVALAQRIITLRGKKHLVYNPFLKYYFQSNIGQYELQSRASGTTVFGIKAEVLRKVPVFLPSISEQKNIASVLVSLDDKIDLLHRQNKTLEAMVETLFRQWFVEEADEGWEEGCIYELIDVIYGYPFSSVYFNEEKRGLPLVRIRDLKNGFSNVYTDEKCDDKYIINCGDLVAGMDGEFKLYIWAGEQSLLNQRLCKFIPKFDFVPQLFVYELMKPHLYYFENVKVGTTVIHLCKADLDDIRSSIPPKDILIKFGEVVNPFYNKLKNNYKQIRILEKLRDTLLPKLMSGEVRVNV